MPMNYAPPSIAGLRLGVRHPNAPLHYLCPPRPPIGGKGLLIFLYSPNLNAYAERWVRSVKEECLSRLILCGEASLRHALTQYVAHFHHERNHQGKGNVLLCPTVNQDAERAGPLQCRERLGGLLKYYTCEAA